MIGLSLSPRGRRKRLKRQMLRQVVDENLRAIDGPTAPPRRSTRKLRGLAVATSGVAVLVILGTLGLTSAWRGRPTPTVDAAEGTSPLRLDPPRSDTTLPPLESPRALKSVLYSLAVKRVVIDPGHGGSDPGATSPSGLSEKEITLDLAFRLRRFLQADGFEVVMTRDTDTALSLRDRIEAANAARGDLFLSIHVNSIPVQQRRGVETYFLGDTTDPAVETLAGMENSSSGYSLADFRQLLEGVWADVRQDESRRLADTIQAMLFATMGRANAELEDRGVKKAPFVVLVGADMPAALAEVSCVSNSSEARLLAQPSYREEIARGLATGVRAYSLSHQPLATMAQDDTAVKQEKGEVQP